MKPERKKGALYSGISVRRAKYMCRLLHMPSRKQSGDMGHSNGKIYSVMLHTKWFDQKRAKLMPFV